MFPLNKLQFFQYLLFCSVTQRKFKFWKLFRLQSEEKNCKTNLAEIGRAGVGAKPLVSIALGAIFKIEMDLLE